MNETESTAAARRRRRARFTRRWLLGLLLGLLAVAGLRWAEDYLVGWNLSVTATELAIGGFYFLVLMAGLGWVLRVVLYSPQRWPIRVGLGLVWTAALLAPLVIWEPIFGGSLWPSGWRPRFWSSTRPLERRAGQADLATVTPLDFPGFLGPRRDGSVEQVQLEPDWKTHPPQLLWKVPIGEGWSGLAAVNGYLVTQQQNGPRECVTCFDLDSGEVVWNFAYARRHQEVLGGVGPRSTPTVFEGRVYALGALGDLYCLDGQNGEPLWSVQLLEKGGIPLVEKTNARGESYQVEQSLLAWGRSASPLISGDLLIVPLGGDASLLALDRRTGAEVWRGGDDFIGYGSASLGTFGGRPQVLLVTENAVCGFDPATGSLLWRWPRPGHSNGDANTSQATAVGQDRVLVSKGYGAGGELLQLTQDPAGTWQVQSLWANARVLKTKLTNPVLDGAGHVFALSDGVLECVDLNSGERLWRAKQRFGHGQILRVGSYVVVHAEDGRLVLVAADPTGYQELGEIPTIDGVCWNTFCLYGERLVVRSDQAMACFRLAVRGASGDDAAAN